MRLSLNAALSLGVVAVVALTAVFVHVPWSLTARANIEDLNDRLDSLVIRGLADKVGGLLDEAVGVRNALVTTIAEGVVDMDDAQKRKFLFLSFLQSQPNLSQIEFAWIDDESFLVRRDERGTIRIERTLPGNDQPTRTVEIYKPEEDGRMPMAATSGPEPSDYHATQEFWYRTAFDVDRPTWSNIFPLPSSGDYGVATVQAAEPGGELLGVVGVSIGLQRLSAFLDSIDITPGSAVFLTNTAGQLVAIQSRSSGAKPQGLPRLDDVDLPAVNAAVAALRDARLDLASLDAPRHLTWKTPAGDEDFVTLAPLNQMGLVVGVVIPDGDVLGSIKRNTRLLLIGLIAFVVLLAGAATWAAQTGLGRPLRRVAANLKELEDLRLEEVRPIASAFTEIAQVSQATMRMSASLASFRKYIPTELVRSLFAQGIEAELGGERRNLTILFMDLADFTNISERLGPRLVEFLSEYLSEMSDRIQAEGGTIDKYIGDAIMAFWNAPTVRPQHAVDACRAALACQARLSALRAEARDSQMPLLKARIGLNSGEVLVGNVGSRDRLNYTAIGDPVNVASRLESLNKVYGTGILLGEDTRAAAGGAIVVRALDRVAVYGREAGLEIYELLGMAEDGTTPAWVNEYEKGRAALLKRDWNGAIAAFERCRDLRQGDTPSDVQIARARVYSANPPPFDWDGVTVMEVK
jgi:adenylate cyclase